MPIPSPVCHFRMYALQNHHRKWQGVTSLRLPKNIVLVVQAPWQRKGLCIGFLCSAGDHCIWRYRTQTLRVFVLGDAAGIQERGSVLMFRRGGFKLRCLWTHVERYHQSLS